MAKVGGTPVGSGSRGNVERGDGMAATFLGWLHISLERQVKAIRTAQERLGEVLDTSIAALGPR